MPVYDLSSGFAGLNQGIKSFGAALQGSYGQQYLQAVGSRMAQGDYDGAARLAYGHGDLETAQGIEQYQQRKQSNAVLNAGLAGLLGGSPVSPGEAPVAGAAPQGGLAASLAPPAPARGADALATAPAAQPGPAIPRTGSGLAPLPALEPHVARATQALNLDPSYIPTTMAIESSGGRDSGGNPGYQGLGQFDAATAARVGLRDRNDPAQAIPAIGRLAIENAGDLKLRIGRDPTPSEAYLAHQQGAGGAAALLEADPGARAADIVGLGAVAGNLPQSMRGQASTLSALDFARFQTGRYDAIARSLGFPPGPSLLARAPAAPAAPEPALAEPGGPAAKPAPGAEPPDPPVRLAGKAWTRAGAAADDSEDSPSVAEVARAQGIPWVGGEGDDDEGHVDPGWNPAGAAAAATPSGGALTPRQQAAIGQLPPAAAKSVATTIATTLPGSGERLDRLLRLEMLAGTAKNQGASEALKTLIEIEKGRTAPNDTMKNYALQIAQEQARQQADLAAGGRPKPLTPYADFISKDKTPQGQIELEYALENWRKLGYPDPSAMSADAAARRFWSTASRKALGLLPSGRPPASVDSTEP